MGKVPPQHIKPVHTKASTTIHTKQTRSKHVTKKIGTMSATTKQLGVTPPLNTRPPTKAETKINEAYEKLVTAELDLFEAPEMNDKRERTLTTLRTYIAF